MSVDDHLNIILSQARVGRCLEGTNALFTCGFFLYGRATVDAGILMVIGCVLCSISPIPSCERARSNSWLVHTLFGVRRRLRVLCWVDDLVSLCEAGCAPRRKRKGFENI